MLTILNPCQDSVTLEEGVLQVREWQVKDPVVIGYLAQLNQDNLAAELEKLLVIGATVLNTARPTLDLGHVKREFDGFHGKLEQSYESFFGQNGQVSGFMTVANKQISDCLEQYLDASSAKFVGAVVREQVEDTLHEKLEKWQTDTRKLFDANSPDSPVNSVVLAVKNELDRVHSSYREIQNHLSEEKGRKAADKKGTQKGMQYELAACKVLSEIALNYGDGCLATNNTVGDLTNCRKGDAIVTLDPNYTNGTDIRIVFEMKNGDIPRQALYAELDEALKNRQAQIAVAVLAKKDLKAAEGWHIRQWSDTHYFCVLDRDTFDPVALQLVYTQVRFEVLKSLKNKAGAGISSQFLYQEISNTLETCHKTFDSLDAIRRHFSDTKSSLKAAENAVNSLTDDIKEHLERIKDLLNRATAIAAPTP